MLHDLCQAAVIIETSSESDRIIERHTQNFFFQRWMLICKESANYCFLIFKTLSRPRHHIMNNFGINLKSNWFKESFVKERESCIFHRHITLYSQFLF